MADKRGSVMQWEFDRQRVASYRNTTYSPNLNETTASALCTELLRCVMDDVVRNGGTLVLVSTPDKLTVVQRPLGAEDPLA